MAISSEWDQKVQQYLAKELSPPEQLDFEKEVAKNPELKAYLQEQIQVRLAIGVLGVEKLREELNELGNQLQAKVPTEPEKAPSFGIVWYLGLAAAAAVAILLYLFLLSPPKTPSPQELFAQYLSIDEETPSLVRTPNTSALKPVDSLLSLADNAYRAQAYQEAISLYEEASKKDSSNAKSLFFLGLSYSFEKQWKESNTALQKVGSASNFYDRAQMYLVKNALDRSDIKEARRLLQKISKDPSNAYQQQAQKLLLDLANIDT